MRVCEFACHWCLYVCPLCAYVLGVMCVNVCECINMQLCVQYWPMEVHFYTEFNKFNKDFVKLGIKVDPHSLNPCCSNCTAHIGSPAVVFTQLVKLAGVLTCQFIVS